MAVDKIHAIPAGVRQVEACAREWLAGAGWSRLHGARPLRGLIRQHVLAPLAELLLKGESDHLQRFWRFVGRR
jgi:ATP-dependent Clp protease ATP-binding subunit ClpA